MHRLLRLVLLAELDRRDPERRRAIERRASDWCERAGDIDAAVRYALGSNDPERAERLVATHGAAHITRGRHLEVRRWIDAFGHDYVVTSASLCLMNAAASTGLGESETTRVWLQLAEEAASRLADAAGLRACVGALRAITATAVDETVLAEAALAHDALPPGPWHAVSAVGLGQLCFATGQRERAIELFDEAAAEGRVAQAVTIEVHGRASLAVAYWEAGDSRRATEAARAARALVREHRFDDNPTLILATGMSALVEAAARSMESARADIALTRHNLAYISSVGTWANVQTRLALARASLLVGDHVGATTFADEAEALLRAEPSLTPPEQLEGIHEQLQAGRAHRQRGPSALTTAEMRVLHYLPTNLTLTEIARRLFVSRNTAKSHTASVYRKLGASSRGEAVEIARTVGLLPSFELDPTPS
jgi:LuxR family maltose regulon positive regulatory protein